MPRVVEQRPSVGSAADAWPSDRFMFATGIECSYPTLEGGRWRMDQMAACGHYRHWRADLELVRELGSALPALRAAAASHPSGPGPVRLGLPGRGRGRDAAARHRADHGPLPLRRARLACRTSRTRRCRRRSPTMPERSPSATRGCGSTRPSTRCTSAPSSARSTACGTSNAGTSAPSSPPSATSPRRMC